MSDLSESTTFTPGQLKALRWIDENDHSRSRWLTKGKDAKGHPRNWDQIEISGDNSMIRIATTDWEAIMDLVMGSAEKQTRLFALTDAGRAAIAKTEA